MGALKPSQFWELVTTVVIAVVAIVTAAFYIGTFTKCVGNTRALGHSLTAARSGGGVSEALCAPQIHAQGSSRRPLPCAHDRELLSGQSLGRLMPVRLTTGRPHTNFRRGEVPLGILRCRTLRRGDFTVATVRPNSTLWKIPSKSSSWYGSKSLSRGG